MFCSKSPWKHIWYLKKIHSATWNENPETIFHSERKNDAVEANSSFLLRKAFLVSFPEINKIGIRRGIKWNLYVHISLTYVERKSRNRDYFLTVYWQRPNETLLIRYCVQIVWQDLGKVNNVCFHFCFSVNLSRFEILYLFFPFFLLKNK